MSNVSEGSSPESDLEISSIVRSGGSDAADFNRSSVSLPLTLEPSESSSFSVTFTPSARGIRDGKFTINSNDPSEPQVDISFNGTGLDRRIAVNGATVAFGEQRVGTRSPTKTLIVSNPGPDVLTVSAVKKVGANAGDFVVAIPAAFSLAPGATKNISVAFQPTGDGLA